MSDDVMTFGFDRKDIVGAQRDKYLCKKGTTDRIGIIFNTRRLAFPVLRLTMTQPQKGDLFARRVFAVISLVNLKTVGVVL